VGAFVNVIQTIDRALARFETWLIVGVVSLMLLMTTAQVLLKLFGLPIIQLEEGARFLVIWVGFAGGAVAAHQGRHINIDIVTRFLKGWPRRIAMCAVWLIGVAISLLLLQTAFSYVFSSEQSLLAEGKAAISIGQPGHGLDIPTWIPAAIMPIGLALVTIHLLFAAVYAAADVAGPGHSAQQDAAGQGEAVTDGGEA